jgi:hypothetical protein
MALAKKIKQQLFENAEYRLERLTSERELSLGELVQISERQEQELMQYVMSLPQARFDKVMAAIGPRWREYTELKLRNRKRMQELSESSEGRAN